ncbi:MAG: hypothetical protein V2A71_05345 [Candidatus Eisenbacteria bacterium]
MKRTGKPAVCSALLVAALACCCLVAASCESRKGLAQRYEAEKNFFSADRLAVAAALGGASAGNVAAAVSALDGVAGRYSARDLEDRSRFSEAEARAMSLLAWRASLRAAGLVAMEGRVSEALRRYAAISSRFGGDREVGASSLYLGARAEEAQGIWEGALATYRRILDGFLDETWPSDQLSEQLRTVPFLMADVAELAGDRNALREAMEKGRRLYSLASRSSSSDSFGEAEARLASAETYAREERWQEYVASLKEVSASRGMGPGGGLRARALLGICRAFKDGLRAADSTLAYCEVVEREFPSTEAAEQAAFLRALVLNERGGREEAKAILRALSGRGSAVGASARLELGAIYEASGKWEDGKAEYRAIGVFFPHSTHYYESLLRIIEHYGRTGNRAAMSIAADEAVAVLKKEAESFAGSGAGLIARGYLVDAYVAAGRTVEAEKELEGISGAYGGWASGTIAGMRAVGMFRARGEKERAGRLTDMLKQRYGEALWQDMAGGKAGD